MTRCDDVACSIVDGGTDLFHIDIPYRYCSRIVAHICVRGDHGGQSVVYLCG